MKKLIAIILTLLMCFSFIACGDKSGTKDGDSGESAVEKELTAENIFDYLVFDIKLENITRWTTESPVFEDGDLAVETPSTGGFAKCDVVLNLYAKKAVTFDSVKIKFDLVPTSDVYISIANKELQLKYDGTAADTYKYACEAEGDNPEFQVVLKEVTGKVVIE